MVWRATVIGLLLAGCSPASGADPDAPNYTRRTHWGYHCETMKDCREYQRCYYRFPNSDGYCVPIVYYDSHPRGCATDRDCEATEVCKPISGAEFGDCQPHYEGEDSKQVTK